MNKFGYSKTEVKLFKRLNSPKKIQDYINLLPFNFDEGNDTCMSPRLVIKNKTAHCMEGAMFAAAALEFHGWRPLVVDLRSVKKPFDYDHVVAIFNQFGCFGSISKTNHAVLRYREPIYKSVRELVMSFFHEYYLENGKKTLREYSDPVDLSHFDKINWRTTAEDLHVVPDYLDTVSHHQILSKEQIKNLRKVDPIEVRAGDEDEYSPKK